MASTDLTSGAIERIAQGLGDNMQPVLQVVDCRLVNTQHSTRERYRILLSDGIHAHQGMIATQINRLVNSGLLHRGSIVRLKEFISNIIQNRRIIIVINMEVLVANADMIGNPKDYDLLNSTTRNGPGRTYAPIEPGLSIANDQHHHSPPASNALEGYSYPGQEAAMHNQFKGFCSPPSHTSEAWKKLASLDVTINGIAKMFEAEADKLQPILQVVEIRMLNTRDSVQRYRVLFSDGVCNQQGVLARQINGIVNSGQLQKGSIVQLKEYICNTIENQRVIVIIDLRVLVEKAEVIWEPRYNDPADRPAFSIDDYVADLVGLLSI